MSRLLESNLLRFGVITVEDQRFADEVLRSAQSEMNYDSVAIENMVDRIVPELRPIVRYKAISLVGSDDLIRSVTDIPNMFCYAFLVSEERLRHVCKLINCSEEDYREIIAGVYFGVVDNKSLRCILEIVREEYDIDTATIHAKMRDDDSLMGSIALSMLYPEDV